MNTRDAINEILQSINEMPLDVSDEVSDVPTAIIANSELEIARKKVLAMGWDFNTLTIAFSPNSSGYIVVPDTYLSADGTDENPEVTIRDWKVFDKENKTFIFTSPMELEVIEDVVFDDIPYHVANYIVQTASLKTYINIIGNTDDVKIRYQELNDARIQAFRRESLITDNNVLDGDYANTLLSKASL